MTLHRFSFRRMLAILQKEFIQLKRDKLTFAMLLLLPVCELILFGYAINMNPRNMPTIIISQDQTPLTRTLLKSLESSSYFKIINTNGHEDEAQDLIAKGLATFVINIPHHFSRNLIRGESPSVLVTVDSTDPSASVNALSALSHIWQNALALEFKHGLGYLSSSPAPFKTIIHSAYNPESITQYNIVPGLMGVVLSMTMVLITCMSITKEKERGTLETLLATPSQPLEVMIGKILPYVLIAYIQIFITLFFSHFLFHIPFNGYLITLLISALPFIAANLTVGLLFSTIAKNQLQAMQMAVFFFLPSLLLTGFMFPFHGMPLWAQWIGNALPLSHFLIIARGIMIKGNGFAQVGHAIWPLITFTLIMLVFCFKRYQRTLD